VRAEKVGLYSPPGGFSAGLVVSCFPLSRCCDPVVFSVGLAASDLERSVADVAGSVCDRAPVSPRPVGGVVPSRVPLVPRFSSVGEVPVAPPRVLGEIVSCGLPPRARGVIAAVACGLAADVAGEAVVAGMGDLVGAGDEVEGGELVPAGDAVVAAPAAPVAMPVVVVAPVVVLEPETPTPTAAPGLTP
jgi:hypothetical protein